MAATIIIDSTNTYPTTCTEYDATGSCHTCSNSGCSGGTTTWATIHVSDTSIAYKSFSSAVDYEMQEEEIDWFEHEYYTEIPQKIDPVKNLITKPKFFIKQPIARSGFRRGQRQRVTHRPIK